MTIVNNWICVILSVFLVAINILVYYIKPDFSYAINDDSNYIIYYQKWLRIMMFIFSLILGVLCIYTSVNHMVKSGYAFLGLQAIIDYCYILVRYKRIVVTNNNIHVYRFMRADLECTFSDINKVLYEPNTRIRVLLKDKKTFDLSFNSVNFNTFYMSLLSNDVKFKIGKIPNDQKYVYLSKFDITINFSKSMFREYYQSKTYLRNSTYLFSARSLDSHIYIEGYSKESTKELDDFIDIIKNDLSVNGYGYIDSEDTTIDELNFKVIKSLKENNKNEARLAYIYSDFNSYFILYVTYLSKNEDKVVKEIQKSIRKSIYEDTRSSVTTI